MSRASIRAFYMLLGGAVTAVAAIVFDIRDYWLGVEPFDLSDSFDPRDIWLMG